MNVLCTTFSGHFFAICVFIFNKTEVVTVVLRCLMGLNLDWDKSYGLRCSLRPHASSANSQKITTDNSHFQTISGHCFAIFMFIFHKTETQTVILRCLMSLNLNFFKSCDTKYKYFHSCFLVILYKNTHLCFLHFFVLCHNFYTN